MSTELKPTQEPKLQGDLSVTALYTAGVWKWAGFQGADLLATEDTQRVFNFTNAALALMRLYRWTLPRLAEGLAQRHTLIDQLTEEYTPSVILELASGLSTRSQRMCDSTHLVNLQRYIEIDLPHVIQYKNDQLNRQEAVPNQLSLKGQDLKNLNAHDLAELLQEVHQPVIIAEGLLMYLKIEETETLLQVIASQLMKTGGRLIFDWVPTVEQLRPGILGRILGLIMRIFTGGESFQRDERTRDDMQQLLHRLGAKDVSLFDTKQVAEERHLPFAHVHTQQLIFCADFSSAPS